MCGMIITLMMNSLFNSELKLEFAFKFYSHLLAMDTRYHDFQIFQLEIRSFLNDKSMVNMAWEWRNLHFKINFYFKIYYYPDY